LISILDRLSGQRRRRRIQFFDAVMHSAAFVDNWRTASKESMIARYSTMRFFRKRRKCAARKFAVLPVVRSLTLIKTVRAAWSPSTTVDRGQKDKTSSLS